MHANRLWRAQKQPKDPKKVAHATSPFTEEEPPPPSRFPSGEYRCIFFVLPFPTCACFCPPSPKNPAYRANFKKKLNLINSE